MIEWDFVCQIFFISIIGTFFSMGILTFIIQIIGLFFTYYEDHQKEPQD
jgi:nucleoside permease NupC